MSSATTVRCPHCNSKLCVKSRRLDGKEVNCPRCTQKLILERVDESEDYIAVLFFQSHDDRWATTIQPADVSNQLHDTAPLQSDNTVSYQRDNRDQRWRWPVSRRAGSVAVGLGLLFCTLLGGYSVIGNEYRVWQTADGRRSSVELAYVSHDETKVRLKRRDNGREIEMPLNRLSDADRSIVESRTKPDVRRSEAITGSDIGRVERSTLQTTEPTPVDWPMWRGPNRDGVVSVGPSLLNSWPSGGPRTLWTNDRIRGEWEGGWGSVSVADGKAYTYVNVPPNKRQPSAYSGLDVVYCLDSNTGEEIWKFENDGGTHTTPSNGTPCVIDGRVYASGSGGYVYCLDATSGREIWQAKTSRPSKETSSSFVIADGVAVVLSGPITGLNADTGEKLWSHSRLSSNHSTAAIWHHGETKFAVCSTDRQLAAINIKSGDIVWQTRLQGANSTPVIDGDRVVVHSKQGLVTYRLNQTEPEELWRVSGGCHGSTPIIHNGFVYSTAAGSACCIRLSDGEQVWHEHIGNSNYSSPTLVDNKLITVGKNRLLMFGTNTNRLERLAEEPMGLVEGTSPTVVDGKLYLRGKRALVCYDLRS